MVVVIFNISDSSIFWCWLKARLVIGGVIPEIRAFIMLIDLEIVDDGRTTFWLISTFDSVDKLMAAAGIGDRA